MASASRRKPHDPAAARKVLLITGSFPPDACGVGDHCRGLAEGLARAGAEVEVYCSKDWNVLTVLKHHRAWRAADADVVILAHPTDGYRKSPAPHFALSLPLAARKLVILHEYTRKSLSGKLACLLFFLFADRVAFTSEMERDAAQRAAPWLKGRTAIIPLASAIPARDPQPPDIDVAYFGLIRPGKGIEAFLAMLEQTPATAGLRVRMIGQTVAGLEGYTAQIRDRFLALGGVMVTDRGPEEVSDLLSRTRVVALPFPDGIGKRRSSALAAMANGALVLSTPARVDQELWSGLCLTAPDPRAMGERLMEVVADPDRFAPLAAAGMAYARSVSWDDVASACETLIGRRNGRAGPPPPQ